MLRFAGAGRPISGRLSGSAQLLLIVHLSAGTLAYIGGYLLVPAGRGDLAELASKLRWR